MFHLTFGNLIHAYKIYDHMHMEWQISWWQSLGQEAKENPLPLWNFVFAESVDSLDL